MVTKEKFKIAFTNILPGKCPFAIIENCKGKKNTLMMGQDYYFDIIDLIDTMSPKYRKFYKNNIVGLVDVIEKVILYEVNLDFKNPLHINGLGGRLSDFINPITGFEINIEKVSKEDLLWLAENGYDSLISVATGQYVALDSKQIKILKK